MRTACRRPRGCGPWCRQLLRTGLAPVQAALVRYLCRLPVAALPCALALPWWCCLCLVIRVERCRWLEYTCTCTTFLICTVLCKSFIDSHDQRCGRCGCQQGGVAGAAAFSSSRQSATDGWTARVVGFMQHPKSNIIGWAEFELLRQSALGNPESFRESNDLLLGPMQ